MSGLQSFPGQFFSPDDDSEIGIGELQIGASEMSLSVGGESLGAWPLEDCDVEVSSPSGRYSLALGDEVIHFAPDSPSSFATAVGLPTSLVDRVREATVPPDEPTGEIATKVEPQPVLTPGTKRRCPYCKETISSDARVCRYCGRESAPSLATQPLTSHLKPYYQTAFAKIDQNDARFLASWNWAAFLFGVFWYFAKGMWAKALILLIGGLILGAVTAGIGFLAVWVYFGVAGNYDLYLKERRGTQLW